MTITGFPKGVRRIKRPPNMTNYRGRIWKEVPLKLPDGSAATATLDTTWGSTFYFKDGEQWWKGPIDDYKRGGPKSLNIDLRETPH